MPIDISAVGTRTLRVCDYVDEPFEAVTAMFAAPDIDDVLATALRAAVGRDARTAVVRTSPPERVGEGVARIHLSWRTEDRAGREAAGRATILLLVVQSGREAVTELLATVEVPATASPRAAAVTRRFLEQVTGTLAAAARLTPGRGSR